VRFERKVYEIRTFTSVAKLVLLAFMVSQTLHSFHDFPKRQFGTTQERKERKERKKLEKVVNRYPFSQVSRGAADVSTSTFPCSQQQSENTEFHKTHSFQMMNGRV
jgi:hypothetical protein